MKNLLAAVLSLCLIPNFVRAQQDYFQQEVNYTIEVTLDDENHTLQGTIEMEYTNNSPDELNEIWLHLWANAFKSRKSAFAKQKVRTGSTSFYFAKESLRGNFSNLDFRVDAKPTAWDYDPENPDIALMKLNEPLKAGQKIIISTPFYLKIPASFSRLGHVGQTYQMTQWFPKPAVYDKDGWHAMPYLDMGEFYSEFGSFDVKITLPENYVVGATGEVQNESEVDFLLKKVAETTAILNKPEELAKRDTIPLSSPNFKTLHYKAERVHDFAWFADKRFKVQKSEVVLASGKTVDTWTMFTNREADLWKESINYVNRAVKFYSENVGEYPYPQASAVQSALSAGGGMEYPMITVIGLSGDAQSLDGVLTHEVGHNWFYGILAFDERDHAWLDEGINSYYDHRYTEIYYEDSGLDILPKFMLKGTDVDMLDVAYQLQARRNLDQAPETTSDDFVPINYFLGAYEKPAQFFKLLEKYLGTAEFDRIFKGFYEKWKFKHPQPEDFKNYVQAESGKDLNWLFEGMIESNKKTDYKISHLKNDSDYQLKVKNLGKLASPFPISGIKDDSIVATQWYEGFEGKSKVDFPAGDYDLIVLDEQGYTLDIDRRNNNIKTKGLFKTVEPLRFNFFAGLEHTKKTTVYWSPFVAWNDYDKTMAGLLLYNTTIPANKFDFAIAPMYAFGSKDVTGLVGLKYHVYPDCNVFQRITFGVDAKSFHFNNNTRHDYDLKYYRIAPSVKFDLTKKKTNSKINQSIELKSVILEEEIADFENFGEYLGNNWENSLINRITYEVENRRVINPLRLKISLEQQHYKRVGETENYLKAGLEANAAYTYKRRKNIVFRLFAGAFLMNTRREAGGVSNRNIRGSLAMTKEGTNDYAYDDFYFGRNEQTGIWSQQVSLREGGFKTPFGGSQSLGQSNNFIVSLNIKADLPFKLPLNIPLKPYFDIGYFDNAQPTGSGASFSDQLMYSGGFMFDFFNGIFGIYLPVVNSENISNIYDGRGDGKYWARIAFNLDLNRASPWRIVDRMEF